MVGVQERVSGTDSAGKIPERILMSLEELIRWNEEINRRGYVRVFRDLLNRPIKAISLDGRVSEWEYDENGRLCACSID